MRRKDREVTDGGRIREIIWDCACCRLGFCDGGEAYIVPLSFGYVEEGGRRTFYFHGAGEGRKAGLIAHSPRVSFELDTGYQLKRGELACNHTARFQSVMGTGRVSFVEDPAERVKALEAVMEHTVGPGTWSFSETMLAVTAVFKLEVEELSCKEHE